MLIKAPLWLVFQTARVGSRRAFFPRGNFGAYNSAAQKNLRPLYRGRTMPYALQSMAKEYRRHLHLYSCIISYPFLFVNKIQTFVRISMLKFDYTCCNFILKCFIMFDKNHCGPKLHEQIFNLNTRISIYKVQRFIPNI